ncbi:MAG: DUF3313 family protein [Prosthecobacter sp.]
MRFLHPFILLAAISLVLPACGTANRLLKARPAKLTPFFEQPELARDGRRQFGFQKVWTTPDRQVEKAGLTKKKLHIAPVTLAYLRPVSKGLARRDIAIGGLKRHERGVAARLHKEFTRAFQQSPAPYYQLTDRPGKDTVVLQLALTELSPTSAKGNALTTAVKFVLTPLLAPLTSLGGFFTKGNIAIEGKMLAPMPGKASGKSPPYRPFFQFADKEADKLTLFSFRDYQSYAHAADTMEDWAVHFEEMTRARKGEKVRDSTSVTLMPY